MSLRRKKLNTCLSRRNIRNEKLSKKQGILLLQCDAVASRKKERRHICTFFGRRWEDKKSAMIWGQWCLPILLSPGFFHQISEERVLERHLRLWVSFLKPEWMEYSQWFISLSLLCHHLLHLAQSPNTERTEPENLPLSGCGHPDAKRNTCKDSCWPCNTFPLSNPLISKCYLTLFWCFLNTKRKIEAFISI